jgi:hypothetical protein
LGHGGTFFENYNKEVIVDVLLLCVSGILKPKTAIQQQRLLVAQILSLALSTQQHKPILKVVYCFMIP